MLNKKHEVADRETEIFPIEKARKNAGEHNAAKYAKLFSKRIIAEINNGIRQHSEQGEYDAQIVLSFLEIFEFYPIEKDTEMFQNVINSVVQSYVNGGYIISAEQIDSSWGAKGVVFTVAWNEEGK